MSRRWAPVDGVHYPPGGSGWGPPLEVPPCFLGSIQCRTVAFARSWFRFLLGISASRQAAKSGDRIYLSRLVDAFTPPVGYLYPLLEGKIGYVRRCRGCHRDNLEKQLPGETQIIRPSYLFLREKEVFIRKTNIRYSGTIGELPFRRGIFSFVCEEIYIRRCPAACIDS